jgi:hypothetical protein
MEFPASDISSLRREMIMDKMICYRYGRTGLIRNFNYVCVCVCVCVCAWHVFGIGVTTVRRIIEFRCETIYLRLVN